MNDESRWYNTHFSLNLIIESPMFISPIIICRINLSIWVAIEIFISLSETIRKYLITDEISSYADARLIQKHILDDQVWISQEMWHELSVGFYIALIVSE